MGDSMEILKSKKLIIVNLNFLNVLSFISVFMEIFIIYIFSVIIFKYTCYCLNVFNTNLSKLNRSKFQFVLKMTYKEKINKF